MKEKILVSSWQEIELNSVDELFEKPDWVGEEVTEDPRYYNAFLAEHPYAEWM